MWFENAQLVDPPLRLCRTRLSGGPDVSRRVEEGYWSVSSRDGDDALRRRGRAR
jgi:hypothetical protein